MADGSDRPISEAFAVVGELCIALGQAPVSKHAGCWECVVDERWKVAMNGHREPQMCSLCTLPIQPFHCYVTFNDWPAFIINPYGGFGASGAAANEDTFIAAVRARIAKEQARPRLDPSLSWPFPTGRRNADD